MFTINVLSKHISEQKICQLYNTWERGGLFSKFFDSSSTLTSICVYNSITKLYLLVKWSRERIARGQGVKAHFRRSRILTAVVNGPTVSIGVGSVQPTPLREVANIIVDIQRFVQCHQLCGGA